MSNQEPLADVFRRIAKGPKQNENRFQELMEKIWNREPITHRMRRGKLVEIPEEWRGIVAHPQKIRKRKKRAAESKLGNRRRRRTGRIKI